MGLRLSDEEMVQVRKIRVEVRKTTILYKTEGETHREAYEEARAKRDRAIRSLSEDGFTNKQVENIMGISRKILKEALEDVRAVQ